MHRKLHSDAVHFCLVNCERTKVQARTYQLTLHHVLAKFCALAVKSHLVLKKIFGLMDGLEEHPWTFDDDWQRHGSGRTKTTDCTDIPALPTQALPCHSQTHSFHFHNNNKPTALH